MESVGTLSSAVLRMGSSLHQRVVQVSEQEEEIMDPSLVEVCCMHQEASLVSVLQCKFADDSCNVVFSSEVYYNTGCALLLEPIFACMYPQPPALSIHLNLCWATGFWGEVWPHARTVCYEDCDIKKTAATSLDA